MHETEQQPGAFPREAQWPVVASRRERGERPGRGLAGALRNSFGVFVRELERLDGEKVLTWRMYRVAKKIAEWSLLDGEKDLDFGSLQELTREKEGRRPYGGLGASDFSEAVNGSPKNRRGLAYLGVVVVSARSVLEAAMPRTIWTPVVDSRLWTGVPADGWRDGPEARMEQLMHVRALRRWPTRALPGLAAEADLRDALVSLHGDMAVEAMPPATHAVGAMPASDSRRDGERLERWVGGVWVPVDGRGRPVGAMPPAGAGCGRGGDARGSGAGAVGVAGGRGRSGGQNVERRGNGGGVLAAGMGIIRVIGNDNVNRFPIGNHCGLTVEELKDAINGDEMRAFRMAARQVIGAVDWDDGRPHNPIGDGGKWVNRWKVGGKSRQIIRAVLLDMIESDLSGGGIAWNKWLEFGGRKIEAELQKNGDPLFKTL